MAQEFYSSETRPDDALFAGEHPPVTLPITLLTGTTGASRGLLLGRVTADGKYTEWNPIETDGTQIARCILTEDIDETLIAAEDVPCRAYFHGPFKEDKIDWSTGNAAQIAAEILLLQEKGIWVE